MSLQPLDLPRRSFVWRRLVEAGGSFTEVNGAACAMDFGAPTPEQAIAARMGLADLSPLPRTGYKGRGTRDWRPRRVSGGLAARMTASPRDWRPRCMAGGLAASQAASPRDWWTRRVTCGLAA